MSASEVSRLAGVSDDTVKRARAALGLRYAKDKAQLADGTQHAVTFLRGVLSLHPMPASHVEEMAEKKGIGARQLERAPEILKVKVQRRGDGQGVCYFLPSQATAEA